MRFVVHHSEKDLRATKVFDDDTELMAIGYTSVKVIQLPLFTLSSERNYSNLVIQRQYYTTHWRSRNCVHTS